MLSRSPTGHPSMPPSVPSRPASLAQGPSARKTWEGAAGLPDRRQRPLIALAGRQCRLQGLAQGADLAGAPATAGGGDRALQAVLCGLLQTALGVADPAQLARQPELAEARARSGWMGWV